MSGRRHDRSQNNDWTMTLYVMLAFHLISFGTKF